MVEQHNGANRARWANRSDFPAIIKLLRIAAVCDEACVPNYLVQHIGMCDRNSGKAVNFVAIKGSNSASFSLELKLEPDELRRQSLISYRGWEVAPWHSTEGYRVHLPEVLLNEDIQFLKPYIEAAQREFTNPRHGSSRSRFSRDPL